MMAKTRSRKFEDEPQDLTAAILGLCLAGGCAPDDQQFVLCSHGRHDHDLRH
jgi:hypothetical protein